MKVGVAESLQADRLRRKQGWWWDLDSRWLQTQVTWFYAHTSDKHSCFKGPFKGYI